MVQVRVPPPSSVLGKALRLPLRLIPPGTVVPVLQGPLRGRKWVVGSGIHGASLGLYEPDKLRHFVAILKPGMTVYDVGAHVGAHVGIYTLLTALAVGESGQVVSFEPLPRNVSYLRRHLTLNEITNVEVVPMAVGDATGPVRFAEGQIEYTSHVDAAGTNNVSQTTLDAYAFADGHRWPDVMKIDVEGAELAALRGAKRVLREARPLVFSRNAWGRRS